MKLHNILSTRSLIGLGAAMALCGAMTACTENEFEPDVPAQGAGGGITFRCADMVEVYKGENNYASRASGPKEEFEKAINTLHVFFFNEATGELMKTTNYDNFQGYMKTNTGFLKIPVPPADKSLFVGGDDVAVHIVAIANIDATDEAPDAADASNSFFTEYSQTGKIAQNSRDKGAAPHPITKYSDLEAWTYYPRLRIDEKSGLGNIRNLPAAGMPMIGELHNVKLNQKSPYVVPLQALMAKIYVSVRLDPEQYTDDLPEIAITEVGVMNMPTAVPFHQPNGQPKNGVWAKPANYQDYLEKFNVTNVNMVHPGTERDEEGCAPELHEYTAKIDPPLIVTRNTEPAVLSYYTYENIQLPDYNAVRTNGSNAFNANLEPQYPPGVLDADKQRWKSTLAYKNRASALILKGTFTTHQEVDYEAKFTVFMGQDENVDFQVKRNYRYDNNITIYGMEFFRNSDDGVYTFDGRLNVVSDNPLYLSIVNERKIDAHASAVPLSVWLMMWEDANNSTEGDPNVNWRSEVTLTIDQPDTHKWIRMGRVIPRAEMEAGGWAAGTGAEPYFTTTLMDELADEGITRTITSDDGSRSRVYFYIDENVPTSNNPTNYGDRYATVKVHYARYSKATNELVETRDYELDFEQRALLKVYSTRSSNGTVDSWMEYYEEYLSHNDPLDQHQMPGELYTGLKWWRVNGVNLSGVRNFDAIYLQADAFNMTQEAITRQGGDGVRAIKLFNTEEPESVFHYCYGKNKRTANGDAAVTGTTGWYTPGITEMEEALVNYYDAFEVMRGTFYWSASAARRPLLRPTSGDSYARATRVTLGSNNKPQYDPSRNDGDPGHQDRLTHNRVRAFYRVN